MASGAEEQQQQMMLPPPPRPHKRKQVLEEDVYAGAIEAIVERDFFPHIPKLQNQLEWLQAVQSGDPAAIKRAQLNIARRRAGLRTPLAHDQPPGGGARPTTGLPGTPGTGLLRTPAMTPALGGGPAAAAAAGAGGATPALGAGATPGRGVAAGPAAAAALEAEGLDPVAAQQAAGARAPGLGLDDFFCSYEGEDNASFQALHEAGLARKRAKMAHHLADKNAPPLLTAGGHATDEYGTSGQAPSTLMMTRHEPKNSLYYNTSQRGPLPLSAAERASVVAGPPKAISHAATRSIVDGGAEQPGGEQQQQAQPGAGKAAAAALAPGTRGYGYERTPQIVPGVGASPLMTWGDIAATPLRLDGDGPAPGLGGAGLDALGLGLGLEELDEDAAAAAGRAFTLPEVRSREAAARSLTATRGAAARRGRGGGGRGGGSATPLLASLRRSTTPLRPGSTTPGSGGLSAAGRKLAQQLRAGTPGSGGRTPGGAGSASFNLALRASYQGAATPVRAGAGSSSWEAATPSRRGGSASGQRRPGSSGGLAAAAGKPGTASRGARGSGSSAAVAPQPAAAGSGANITDDLLKL